jgi:signal peptidase II
VFAYSLLYIAILIIDRLTKWWAINNCIESWHINNYFSCELALNRGISFNLFSFADTWCFSCVTLLVIGITGIVALHAWQKSKDNQSIYAEIIVLAGATSNIIDRFIYGGVVDFIVIAYKSYAFPTFNIADIAIVLGVALMVYEMYKQ